MKWNKKIIQDALVSSSTSKCAGEGIRLRRSDGGCDHVYLDDDGNILTYAAGRNWSDQAPHKLGEVIRPDDMREVVASLYERRGQIYSLNGNQFREIE